MLVQERDFKQLISTTWSPSLTTEDTPPKNRIFQGTIIQERIQLLQVDVNNQIWNRFKRFNTIGKVWELNCYERRNIGR